MPKYRKKPVVIEAVIWTGSNQTEVSNFMKCSPAFDARGVKISTMEGDMYASNGDYIIRGVQGELYPCKPDIFEATYEAV